jgi:hypothetical protein
LRADLTGIDLTPILPKGVTLPKMEAPKLTGDFGLAVLTQVAAKMKETTELSKAFGAEYDVIGAKTNVLEGAIQSLIENGFTAQSQAVQALLTNLDAFNQKTQQTIDLSGPIQQATQQATEAFLDFGIGLATGADSAVNLATGMFESLGNIMINLGKTALMAGFGIEAIKKSLFSLQGPVAIAAGAALIGFGAVIKNAVKGTVSASTGGGGGGGRSGGGGFSMAPPRIPSTNTQQGTAALRASAVSSQVIEVKVTGELVGRGSALVGVIREEEKRTKRVGAGG